MSLGSCHLIVSIMAGLRFLVCKEKRNVVSPDTFFDVCFLCQNFGSQVCYKRCSSDTLVSLSTISFDDLVLSCLGYQHLFIYGYIFVTICGARFSARSSLSNCSSTRRERSKWYFMLLAFLNCHFRSKWFGSSFSRGITLLFLSLKEIL